MDNSDKLVAAILAAARCSAAGDRPPTDYLDQYDEFIRLMGERRKAAKKPMKINPDAMRSLGRRLP